MFLMTWAVAEVNLISKNIQTQKEQRYRGINATPV